MASRPKRVGLPHLPHRVSGSVRFEADDSEPEGYLVFDPLLFDPLPEANQTVDETLALRHFRALAKPSAATPNFVDFASRYGPLLLCASHGLAPYYAHGVGRQVLASSEQPSSVVASETPREEGIRQLFAPYAQAECNLALREPLREWRRYAQDADATMELSNNFIMRGGTGAERHWRQLRIEGGVGLGGLLRGKRNAVRSDPQIAERISDPRLSHDQARSIAAETLQRHIREWMRWGALQHHYELSPTRAGAEPSITFQGAGVLGIIARQLLFQAGRVSEEPTRVCEKCNCEFHPKTALSKYCGADCRDQAIKDSKARSARIQRGKGRKN